MCAICISTTSTWERSSERFGLAYALFEIPTGWLGDWMGPRKVLMRIVLWWSAFTALTGAMRSFVTMWITRFLFGVGEAGCFPNLTKAFTTWLPPVEHAKAQGIMWTFARWGGAFTPVLVVLVLRYVSWRYAFVVFAALGSVWAFFSMRWYRDDPRQHKGVNAAELALLAGSERLASGHGTCPGLNYCAPGPMVAVAAIFLPVLSLVFLRDLAADVSAAILEAPG